MLARVAQDRREETAELERALRAAVEGFEVRDEEILLEGSPSALRPGGEARRAELAGTMEGGRAVLVLRPSRRDGPAELAAIDALAWTEECGEVLALRVGADPGRDVL